MTSEPNGNGLGGANPFSESGAQKQLQQALEELNVAVADFASTSNADTTGSDLDKTRRQKIMDAAQKVLYAVKDPADEWIDMTIQISVIGVNRLFWKWGVFDLIPVDGDISYGDLASAVDAEVVLLTRLAGVLVSNGVLKQIGGDRVAHTPRSRIFTKREERAGLVYQLGWDNGLVPYVRYPEYFEKYGRKEPQTMNHVPTTFAYGHPEWSYYEMISRDPERMRMFMKAMAPIEEKMPIAGIYDFGWLVEKAKDPATAGRKVFVDVGGGGGHAIKAIHAEFPDLPLGRFVLQDRPEVIAAVKSLDDPGLRQIQAMEIDFHVGQPVKGALVYWIRRCLHNYPDQVSTNILSKVVESMADDSKVLLEEDVMDNPPNPMAAMLDMVMLGFGGKQRTLETWEKVTSAAGLQITSVSRGKGPWRSLSVIECAKQVK